MRCVSGGENIQASNVSDGFSGEAERSGGNARGNKLSSFQVQSCANHLPKMQNEIIILNLSFKRTCTCSVVVSS